MEIISGQDMEADNPSSCIIHLPTSPPPKLTKFNVHPVDIVIYCFLRKLRFLPRKTAKELSSPNRCCYCPT